MTPATIPAGDAPPMRSRAWARWLVLVPFALVLVWPPGLDGSRGTAMLWSAASMAASALVVWQLAGDPGRVLWAWILVALFGVGYAAQTLLASQVAGDPVALQSWLGRDKRWLTPEVVAQAHGWISASIVAACLAIALALRVERRFAPAPATPPRGAIEPGRLAWLLAGVGVVAAATVIARVWLDIGVLGRETRHLPWRVDTVIFRSQSHLLPALLLYALWAAEQRGRSRLAQVAGALLFALQVAVSLISTSKAGLVWFALPVLFLWICDRRLTARRAAFVGVILAGVIVAYPVITALRYARVWAPGVESAADVGRATATRLASQSPGAMVRETAWRLAVRVNGAAGVWFTLRAAGPAGGLDRLWPDRGVPLVLYFTRDVCGVRAPGDFRQPGLVAAFLMAGGSRGFVALWVVLVGAAAAAWRVAGALQTAAVARALIGFHLLLFVNEGALHWPDVAAALVGVILVEGVHRWLITAALPVPGELRG